MKEKPKIPQKTEKEIFYTWTKKWGWRVNGYITQDKKVIK